MSKRDRKNALVVGSTGGIGAALVDALAPDFEVTTLNRVNTEFTDSGLIEAERALPDHIFFSRIVCATGILHGNVLSPEKSLGQINSESLETYFLVNTIIPAILLRTFSPRLCRRDSSVFACLSAMVGSIGENRLGGWYGYRSSKAALNMMVKTASIEIARHNRNAAIVCIHPGTTRTSLSDPYTKNNGKMPLYDPEVSASRIIRVMDSLGPENTGEFRNWNGEIIPW
ncbi:MAG: SDR family NAD(P)-dependent oxidoreductase [Pseudomonadota bacterium]